MSKREIVLLVLVLLLALFLRLYGMDLYPPSLNWDEVSHGYNAYSILSTGHDEWGKFMPSIFRAFGDYKLPVYIYLTVPMVWMFGLSAYGVRLVSALAGVGSVLFVYFIVRFLENNRISFLKKKNFFSWGAVISALAMAVSPWTVFLSRIAVEANLASFFIASGLYYFLLGVKQRAEGLFRSWAFVLSGLLFGLSLFTYNSARVFVPLLLLLLVWVYRKSWQDEKNSAKCVCHLLGLGIFLMFFAMMIYQMALPSGQARFQNISVLDSGTINRINESRGHSELTGVWPRLVYNKATFLIARSAMGYVSYFDPRFWFVNGGKQYQFSVPGMPLIYPVNGVLFLLGLLSILGALGKFKVKKEVRQLVLGWLLLAPIPASPTRDNPHVLRIITAMTLMYVLIGWGGNFLILKIKDYKIKSKLKTKILTVFLLGYLLFLFVGLRDFWFKYTHEYRMDYAWAWQYGNSEMVDYVKVHYTDFAQIFVTKKYGEPHEFMLFYWPWSPKDYVQKKIWDYHDGWYWVNGLDKFIFVNDWEIKEGVKCEIDQGKCLLITSPGNAPDGWIKIDGIPGLNGEPVFEIYEK